MTAWVEYHVFLHGRPATDAFLRGALPRLLDRVGGRGWFIRYWHGGPHLRVRVPADRDGPAIEQGLRDAAADHAGCATLTPQAFYAGHSFDGAPVDPAALPWFGDGCVRRRPYIPETALYGEGEALSLNEALFCDASSLALRLLAALPDAALLPRVAADLLLGALDHLRLSNRAASFGLAYRAFLSPFAGADLVAGRPSTPAIMAVGRPGAAWQAMLGRYEAGAEQPLRRIVLQQHLLMNRLGIAPRHEALLFDRLHGEVAHG
jgi:hypothetical protein